MSNKPNSLLIYAGTSAFLILTAMLLHSPRYDNRQHQTIADVVGLFIFATSAVSLLRHSRAPATRYDTSSLSIMLAALTGGFLAYGATVFLGFISDDFTHIRWASGRLLEILWDQAVHGQYGTFIRPIGFSSLALDYRLWHVWAPGWHLTNLALHLATTAALYWFCKEVGWNTEISGSAAALFALLPINTEAVSWIAARFDLLATLLMLLTLIFYARARRRHLCSEYLFALLLFVLSLLTKESAFILPIILLVLESVLFDTPRWRRLAPFFLCVVVALGYRLEILGSLGGYARLGDTPASSTLGPEFMRRTLMRAPAELLFGVNWQQPRVALSCVLIALTAGLLVPLTFLPPSPSSKRPLAFSLLWCYLSALPAQSLLMIPPSLTNSRILYFSAIGAAMFMALLVQRIASVNWRIGWIVTLGLCLFVTTQHNISAWRGASTITRSFLRELHDAVPDPKPNSVFVLHDMPSVTEGGVYLLVNIGLADAVRLTFNRSDVSAQRLSQTPKQSEHPVIDIYWCGDYAGKRRPLICQSPP